MSIDASSRSLLLALGIGLALGGCSHPAAPPAEESHPAPVKAATAQMVSYGEWTEILGTTQPLPNHVAKITAPTEGRVLLVQADGKGSGIEEGQEVHAGQEIVHLDDRVLRANLAKAEANLQDLAEQKAQADIALQSAQLELRSKEELRRQSANSPTKLVTPIELERARLAVQDAVSKQKGIIAKQKAGDAEVKAINEQLKLYTLRSPIDGRLGMLQVMPGQTLAVGTAVAEVTNLTEIDVLCFVPPHVAGRLALDQLAQLEASEASSSGAAEGRIVYVAEQAQPDTGCLAVKVRFANRQPRLRANLVVHVRVRTQPEKERLAIPEAALLEDQDPPGVVIVQDLKVEKKDDKEEKLGKAERLQAQVGVRDREHHLVEILGLKKAGEKAGEINLKNALFIVEGAHGLQDDDPVAVEQAEAKEEK